MLSMIGSAVTFANYRYPANEDRKNFVPTDERVSIPESGVCTATAHYPARNAEPIKQFTIQFRQFSPPTPLANLCYSHTDD